MKYRFLNWIKAHLCGYFWLPCPLCGNNFGGHEWQDGNDIMRSASSGSGVCSDCGDDAREINKINFGT